MRMRTRSIILVVGYAIVLAGSGIHAPAFSEAAQTADMAADEGLAELQELVRLDTFKGLGFTSQDEKFEALVDKESSLQVYTVELNALRKFKRGDNAEKLRTIQDIIIYPVKVGTTVRSSMTVTKAKGGTSWDVTGWGAPGFIEGLTSLSFSASNIVVWIPELNIFFLGEFQHDGKLMLASISSKPEFNLERRVWKQDHEVFLQLSKLLPTVKPYKPGNPANPREPG
jgi:hypothetical protein